MDIPVEPSSSMFFLKELSYKFPNPWGNYLKLISKLETIASVGSGFILRCLFALFKAILLEMGRIEVSLAAFMCFPFYPCGWKCHDLYY